MLDLLRMSHLEQCASFLGVQVALYAALAPFFKTDKERAYILSTCTSLCMTLSSLPFLLRYLAGGFAHVVEMETGWAGHQGARTVVVFFGCYLLADLVIGALMYPKQVGLLTGWIHHTVYIGIMYHLAVNTRLSPVFMVACIMELPTFHLSFSHLAPRLRHDGVFLALMFATRIVFHAFLLADCAFPSAALQDSYFPVGILIPVGILHAGWFSNGTKGYMKRRGSSKNAIIDHPAPEALAATAVKPENLSEMLPSSIEDDSISSGSSSPSETPLITPRTTTPSTLFPSLGLQLPLPTKLQLPPLSFPDHRTFSNAVKQQWEDKKDRFRQG